MSHLESKHRLPVRTCALAEVPVRKIVEYFSHAMHCVSKDMGLLTLLDDFVEGHGGAPGRAMPLPLPLPLQPKSRKP